MSILRKELIRIQKKNYWKNVELVRDSLEYNPVVETYEKEYFEYLNDYQGVSNKAELIKKVVGADLVFHGDYHTLKQSQRCVLRILREIQGKRDFILCLEMLHGADQKIINAFMEGELSEGVFIRKIDYRKKWPFSWQNWSPIIYFCQDHGIPIIGINSPAGDGIDGIRARDRYSAKVIAKILLKNPDKLIYVVDGDFHVSPNHLPNEVEQLLTLLDVQARSVMIYQNAENLFWKLCEQGKEESDVIRISENSFCIMNTMPANKVQSYLNWLEYSEDAYYPVHGEWDDDGYESQSLSVQDIASQIAAILRLELPPQSLERLNVYYADDLDFMDLIHNMPEVKGKIRLIKEKMKNGEGFLLEYGQAGTDAYLIYLPNSNLNMAAEEASHFVNAVCRGRMTADLSLFDRFYWNVIAECLGFFGSKFINEKRKAHSENSLRRLLGLMKRGEWEYPKADSIIPQAARFILQHYALQRQTDDPDVFFRKFESQYRNRSILPFVFSTQLGYMLGNKLYYAVKKGRFPLTKIRSYFREPFAEKGKAFSCYLEISHRLKEMKHVSQF
ncbi:MAG: ChaN family lipoprotein [Pseudomonadota bacterium]